MNLFDHLNNITLNKSEWDTLSDEDKKSWNTFMVNRYVSMKEKYIDLSNLIQKYSTLSPKMVYTFYKNIIPKEKAYFKYIKANKKEYNKELVSILSSYFECSNRESKNYIDILKKEEIISILKSTGKDDKEIKKLLK
jgi:hypothetical protein